MTIKLWWIQNEAISHKLNIPLTARCPGRENAHNHNYSYAYPKKNFLNPVHYQTLFSEKQRIQAQPLLVSGTAIFRLR